MALHNNIADDLGATSPAGLSISWPALIPPCLVLESTKGECRKGTDKNVIVIIRFIITKFPSFPMLPNQTDHLYLAPTVRL